MRGIAATILIFLVTMVHGNPMDAEPRDDILSHQKVSKIIDKFSDKENSVYQAERLFYRVHRQLLKQYKQHSEVNDLLQDGEYDCLTGTLLYGHILNALSYDFEIIELDYHIYLKLEVNGETILIESTDPYSGFIRGQEVIKRVNAFMLDQKGKNKRIVSLNEMPGLILYNSAVNQFNKQKFIKAFNLLAGAFEYTRSAKMDNLLKLTIAHIVTDEAIGEEDLRAFLDIYLSLMKTESIVQISGEE